MTWLVKAYPVDSCTPVTRAPVPLPKLPVKDDNLKEKQVGLGLGLGLGLGIPIVLLGSMLF